MLRYPAPADSCVTQSCSNTPPGTPTAPRAILPGSAAPEAPLRFGSASFIAPGYRRPEGLDPAEDDPPEERDEPPDDGAERGAEPPDGAETERGELPPEGDDW